ncbi:MAG: hypothetical protein ACI3VR_02345 [Intestinibacter sp.]|uniref:hypothetical protein n=1 Tax=Intestinibacter sp. TaxID=1965304 RepID=UPI003F159D34
MPTLDQERDNNRSINILEHTYPKIMENIELIKAAETIGIYIDGEYKNMLGKIIKLYLAKSNSYLRAEIRRAEMFQGDSIDKFLLEKEDKEFFDEE